MLTPTSEQYFILNEDDTAYPVPGALSLNEIATEFYGRKYVGQQVGDGGRNDMFSNDSVYEFDMTEDDPNEHFWQIDDPEASAQTYLGYDVPSGTTMYHEGHNREEYWKSMSWSDDPDKVTHPDNPGKGEDCYGAVFRYDFQVYREAPNVTYTLARLIKAGVLPYGKYLLYVSW